MGIASYFLLIDPLKSELFRRAVEIGDKLGWYRFVLCQLSQGGWHFSRVPFSLKSWQMGHRLVFHLLHEDLGGSGSPGYFHAGGKALPPLRQTTTCLSQAQPVASSAPTGPPLPPACACRTRWMGLWGLERPTYLMAFAIYPLFIVFIERDLFLLQKV